MPQFSWSSITAIYGGTFDPPHRGHFEAVEGLFRFPGVRGALILPAGVPPLKGATTAAYHRLAMTRLAFQGLRDASIDDRELRRSESGGAPSYTSDTLLELRRERNPSELAFVVGTDQLPELPRWKLFPELLSLCHWIVLERKPDSEQLARRSLREWQERGWLAPLNDRRYQVRAAGTGGSWSQAVGPLLELVPTPARALSSREIRASIQKNGEPPRDSLAPEVLAYLKAHRLYGSVGL
jgi:nicotinate-nucleotide adenylyltransferase